MNYSNRRVKYIKQSTVPERCIFISEKKRSHSESQKPKTEDATEIGNGKRYMELKIKEVMRKKSKSEEVVVYQDGRMDVQVYTIPEHHFRVLLN